MVAAKTIKQYIERCDKWIENPDNAIGSALVKEILSVFLTDFEGLKQGVSLYSFSVMNGISQQDVFNDIHILRARLKKELDAIEPQYVINNGNMRDKKIFISHATVDKVFVVEICSFLESLGFREDDIICSSVPPYCIPLDNDVYPWLVNSFQNLDLHVIYVLSHNYYSRPACLNEMGAVWALKQRWTAMLLPGFGFEDVQGCIAPLKIGIKLDDLEMDILKHRLGELKDNLISEFDLRQVNNSYWERKRDAFIERIRNTQSVDE